MSRWNFFYRKLFFLSIFFSQRNAFPPGAETFRPMRRWRVPPGSPFATPQPSLPAAASRGGVRYAHRGGPAWDFPDTRCRLPYCLLHHHKKLADTTIYWNGRLRTSQKAANNIDLLFSTCHLCEKEYITVFFLVPHPAAAENVTVNIIINTCLYIKCTPNKNIFLHKIMSPIQYIETIE